MPLSEQEQRLLDEMERNLYHSEADDVAPPRAIAVWPGVVTFEDASTDSPSTVLWVADAVDSFAACCCAATSPRERAAIAAFCSSLQREPHAVSERQRKITPARRFISFR